MYQCISVAKVDPAKRDEVIAAAKVLAKETRMQEGNLSYNVVIPEGTEDTIVITERWESPENFRAHVAFADKEGDPLNTFGKVMDPAATAPPMIFPGPAVV